VAVDLDKPLGAVAGDTRGQELPKALGGLRLGNRRIGLREQIPSGPWQSSCARSKLTAS
jgi:hypothetical protein